MLKRGALWKLAQKYLERFEIWRWRKMEKISWTDRVRNEGVLRTDETKNKMGGLHPRGDTSQILGIRG